MIKAPILKANPNPPAFRLPARPRCWPLFAAFFAASAAYGVPNPPGVINASSGDITTSGGTEQGVSVNWEVDGGADNINVGGINGAVTIQVAGNV